MKTREIGRVDLSQMERDMQAEGEIVRDMKSTGMFPPVKVSPPRPEDYAPPVQRAIAAESEPTAKLEPLPKEFRHPEGISRVGKLASEAIAREYLQTADQIADAANKMLDRARAAEAEMNRRATEMFKEAEEAFNKHMDVAEEYRREAMVLFETITAAAMTTSRAVDIAHSLSKNIKIGSILDEEDQD